ncbi:hypothetical protein [Sphingomonas montana]|uniref:hypothetical protein n=1 Tax=Sphingomonas montana TaxID=1843236 RepID=UPI00096E9E57|nr:hypothetical protein [Sphingomonas montana]
MTADANLWIIAATAALAALVVATHAALIGWRGWLDLRRLEIEGRRDVAAPSPGARIELADLRERIRKLEAIAAGVEL